ncbi:MAG TPA: circadian clock KaiB family protein [Thermodesulfobacteriota bacterium]|nr:circadian clock KaiB family protein [Thermodesulfobacteriota bacterium]
MRVRERTPRKKTKKTERLTGIFVFRLYVAGKTAKSIAAFTNLTRICQEHLNDKCRITVIDIFKNPQLAKAGQIVAIPTLVKTFPLPMQRVIGDLSSTERVLRGLHIGFTMSA